MKGGVENTYKNLHFCFWNINGRKHLIRSEKIQKWLSKNFDIVFLSETHLLKGEKYKIDSFKDYHNAFSTNEDQKARGGVSCFINNSALPHISKVEKDSTEVGKTFFANR